MGVLEFWLVIFVIGSCFQVQVLSSRNLKCNPDDLKALESFMNSLETGIADWGNNPSSSCCEWAGITCNSSSSLGLKDATHAYRVVKLELPSKRLVGKLSESLGKLEQLRTLNLSHNFLKDSVPPLLFHLPNLEVLDLSSNFFSGPIPIDTNLPSIQSLDMSQNFLNGSLSNTICGYATQLRVLNLAVNHFSGNLPPSLGNCSSLEILSLGMNHLSGGIPEGIFRLQELTRFNIQDNNLSGLLSKEVGNLINLYLLDISTNWFSGTIPDVFHSLGRLQSFVAHSNNFSGQLPPSLTNSPTITLLNVRNNSLEGPVDLNCSAMTSLISLDLSSNRFEGPVPSNLPSCRNLNGLNLSRNKFGGRIPESFKNFRSLSYLSLSNSSISNISSALQILQSCQNLTVLILSLNFRDEELPAEPTLHFARLKILAIGNSRLRGSIPQWLSSSSLLQVLDLSWNCLEGKIPDWLGDFNHLFFLDVSNNTLTGSIPRSITGLRSLMITTRNFSAVEPLPDFPFFMTKNESLKGFQYNRVRNFPAPLELSNNNLTGPIWPEFGNLKGLHILVLKWNNLSGPIPDTLSQMTNLETLDLSHNNLSGVIPDSFAGLSFLSEFSVADNNLEGVIPTEGQFSTFPSSSFEGNNLCGYQDFPCSSNLDSPPSEAKKSRLEYAGVATGVAVGLVFGIVCFVVTDRYVWNWTF